MARIAIVGLGCVGSRTARLLKKFKPLLVDFDSVRAENIGCQLYSALDFEKPKAVAAAEKNNGIAVVAKLTPKNASRLLKNAGIVVDCTDNWTARKAIDDYCAEAGKPWVYAGAIKNYGMVSTVTRAGNFAKWAKRQKQEACHIAGISVKACEWAARTQAREVKALLEKRKPRLDGKIEFFDAGTEEKSLLVRLEA